MGQTGFIKTLVKQADVIRTDLATAADDRCPGINPGKGKIGIGFRSRGLTGEHIDIAAGGQRVN